MRRVRSTTKWLAGGAAGLTALFTAFTLPHKSSNASTTNSSGSSVSSSNTGSSTVSSNTGSSGSSSSSNEGFSSSNGVSSSSQQPVTRSGAS